MGDMNENEIIIGGSPKAATHHFRHGKHQCLITAGSTFPGERIFLLLLRLIVVAFSVTTGLAKYSGMQFNASPESGLSELLHEYYCRIVSKSFGPYQTRLPTFQPDVKKSKIYSLEFIWLRAEWRVQLHSLVCAMANAPSGSAGFGNIVVATKTT